MQSTLTARTILWLGLSISLSFPAPAVKPEPLLKEWSETILNALPERRLGANLAIQENSAKHAARGWIGMSSLNLAQESTRTSAAFPVENTAVSLQFPLKVFHQKKVFERLAHAYRQQSEHHLPYRQWQARGIARELINQIEEQQIHARAARQRLRQAEQLHQLVQAQVQAGESSKLDESLAAQRLSQSRVQWQSAWQSLLTRWQQAATWGIPHPEEDSALLAPLNNPIGGGEDMPGELNLNENWLAHHPLLQWQQAQWNSTVAAAHSDWWEARNTIGLDVGAIREKAFSTPEYTLINVAVSLPLGRSPAERQAKARWQTVQNQRDISLQRLRLDLQRQWQLARAEWNKARQLLKPAQAQWHAARQALKLTEQSWQQGESSLRDLLLAQQAELDARLAADLARQQLAAAKRNLEHASGE